MFSLLSGIKVVDLTTIVLGPYATQFLGDFGAEVIKVENLEGDLFRTVRPGRSASMGAGFLNCNRNKKSIAIDLKTAEGREILYQLIKTADVVVHNMRLATAERLGVDYDSIKAVNNQIVYCYAPGYGQSGEYAHKPAYDDIIQAESGIAHLNRDSEGKPRFIPTIICDKVGGLHLALSVLSGLIYRAKQQAGCSIEAPMFEGMVSFLMTEQLAGESFVPPLGGTGYERLSSPYRKPFPTADGYISILPYNTRHWQQFFRLTGHTDMVEHELVTNPIKRSENVGTLYKLISECTPAKTTQQWSEELTKIDVPFAPVNDMNSLLTDPHLTGLKFYHEYDHPSEGRLRHPKAPFYMRDVAETSNLPPPRLGENTRAILQELGLSSDQMNELEKNNIVLSARNTSGDL